MRNLKVIVEKHDDGYIAYPLGLKGVVVGEGESYDEALADVRSAIRFHIETFGEVIKGSTLRTVCTQSGIPRDEFLAAYE